MTNLEYSYYRKLFSKKKKRKEKNTVLIQPRTWMDLKNMMVNKRHQSANCLIPFIGSSKITTTNNNEKLICSRKNQISLDGG
jgi:hypothetical protein